MHGEHFSCRSPGHDLWDWSLLLDSIHVVGDQRPSNEPIQLATADRKDPFIAVTDSRSLFDNLSKSTNIASHVDDKRTAIDLTILKNDLQHTRGQLRWVAGEIMISDALTKKGPASFLRGIMKLAYWTLFEVGAKELKQQVSANVK